MNSLLTVPWQDERKEQSRVKMTLTFLGFL